MISMPMTFVVGAGAQEPMRESMRMFEGFVDRLFDGGLQIFRTPEGGLMWLAPKPSSARTLRRP